MIVISDVHGCVKTLEALLAKLPPSEEVCFVGDLIDRGPGSAAVVKLVREKGYRCVRGNHEEMLIDALYDPQYGMNDFLRNGGTATLDSYGIFHHSQIIDSEILKSDVEWMNDLPTYIEFLDVKNKNGLHLLVTHSSAHSVWHLKDSEDLHDIQIFNNSILWSRLPNIQQIPDIYNIFGHTVQQGGPKIKYCYANIDTGCCFVEPGFGVLTAIQFPDMIIYTQENLDMKAEEGGVDGI